MNFNATETNYDASPAVGEICDEVTNSFCRRTTSPMSRRCANANRIVQLVAARVTKTDADVATPADA